MTTLKGIVLPRPQLLPYGDYRGAADITVRVNRGSFLNPHPSIINGATARRTRAAGACAVGDASSLIIVVCSQDPAGAPEIAMAHVAPVFDQGRAFDEQTLALALFFNKVPDADKIEVVLLCGGAMIHGNIRMLAQSKANMGRIGTTFAETGLAAAGRFAGAVDANGGVYLGPPPEHLVDGTSRPTQPNLEELGLQLTV